jgi:hypothetical protein
VKVTFEVSVRWWLVLGVLAVFCLLKLKEAIMDSCTSVVLSGAALLPASGDKTPTNMQTRTNWTTNSPGNRVEGFDSLRRPFTS